MLNKHTPRALDAELLDRYLAGGCDAADVARVEEWLRAVPARAEALTALRRELAGGAAGGREVRVTAEWERLAARLGGSVGGSWHAGTRGADSPAVTAMTGPASARWAGIRRSGNAGDPGRTGWGRLTRRPWLGIAGAITLVLVMVGVTLLDGRRGGEGATSTSVVRTYATGTGQQAVLTLGDGTRVTLASRTTLRVATFDARSRTVMLDGEAYFNVPRAWGAPFVVRTGRVSTRVLGTAFLVSHYAGDGRVRVAVASGKVTVSANTPLRPNVTLVAGAVGEVTDSTATAAVAGDVAGQMGWLDGRLVFQDAAAAAVLQALTRWYGYEFRLTDAALADERVTGVVSTRSSAEALATLKLLLDVDLRFDGTTVTMTPRRARRVPARERRDGRELIPTHTNEVGR